jgi:hypothetical protein
VCPSPSSSTHSDNNITPPPTNSNKSHSCSPQNRSFSNYSTSSTSSSFPGSPSKQHLSNDGSLPAVNSSSSYYHPYHYVSINQECSNTSENPSHNTSAPLSLHERRLRNKTASAKYRAKKNQQHGEMRAMISSLTKENELLLRQLDHVQHENGHLKSTCDRLRGKLMAQKMLKQYLVETEQQQQSGNSHSIESIPSPVTTMDNNNYFVQYTTRKYPEVEEKRGLGLEGLRNDSLV